MACRHVWMFGSVPETGFGHLVTGSGLACMANHHHEHEVATVLESQRPEPLRLDHMSHDSQHWLKYTEKMMEVAR